MPPRPPPPPPGHGRDFFFSVFETKEPNRLFLFIFVSRCFPPVPSLTTSCHSPSSQVHLMLFVGSRNSWQSNLFPARFSVGLSDSLFCPCQSFVTFSLVYRLPCCLLRLPLDAADPVWPKPWHIAAPLCCRRKGTGVMPTLQRSFQDCVSSQELWS